MATMAELQKEMERLKAENAALSQKVKDSVKAITLKVSEKGGVSVYGLGRFPVSLYESQMRRLLDEKDNIITFMDNNSDKLRKKGDPAPTPKQATQEVTKS